MKLERVPSKPACQLPPCKGCGCSLYTDYPGAFADLDGPAFETYYCPECVIRILNEEPE
jgi:hypothetical protein